MKDVLMNMIFNNFTSTCIESSSMNSLYIGRYGSQMEYLSVAILPL